MTKTIIETINGIEIEDWESEEYHGVNEYFEEVLDFCIDFDLDLEDIIKLRDVYKALLLLWNPIINTGLDLQKVKESYRAYSFVLMEMEHDR